jgi:hypothetical protein
MATTISSLFPIPRFLLPRTNPLWRVVLRANNPRRQDALRQGHAAVAHYGSKPSAPKRADKPVVLEKPLKFNPPSHGSRLPKKQHVPKHYGAVLTADEVAAQSRRQYPGLMAPEGTWAHWFWTSRKIHIWITMVRVATGTLGIARPSWPREARVANRG